MDLTLARCIAGLLPALAGLLVACGDRPDSLGTAVEYRNTRDTGYRLATSPDEVSALDAQPDVWMRTGGEFTISRGSGRHLVAVCKSGSRYTDDCTSGRAAFYARDKAGGACPPDSYPVFASRRNDGYRFTTDAGAHARSAREGFLPEGVAFCSPRSRADVDADIVRLLEQATFGPTEKLIDEVRERGVEAWLDEQLAKNITRYTQYPFFVPPDDPTECIDDAAPPVTPAKYCHTYRIAPWPVGWEFYRQSKTGPDQVRMRMAHVWHQIFVVSDGPGTYAYATFHQMLRDHALGTFEDLVTKYALAPFLGEYQNWLYNEPERDGLRPNENFARELMQLFTIGVTELNDDGTPRLDAAGVPLPTYTQADIETLARVLTGFGFPPLPGRTPEWRSTRYYVGDMVPFEDHHDKGPKRMLGGRLDLPAGGTAMDEVRAAIRMLVEHPNAPPFISKQLIQKLVTSDPTPAYVSRVAHVFKDNGRGQRGDLTAVTRAVLLDPEARGARKVDPRYGRLREPALFWTAIIRALDVTTDGVIPYEDVASSGQRLFLAPSVFNYYATDYAISDGTLPAPEFAIYGSSEFLNRSNQLVQLLYDADLPILAFHYGPRPWVIDAKGTRAPLLSAFLADAASPASLVERLDRLFLHGTMRPAHRRAIIEAVGSLPQSDALGRTRMALRLTLASIDYQIQK